MVTDKPRLQITALAAVLLLVNVYVCRELFWTEYLDQMPSIEAAFIGIARYASQNWGDLTWAPFWYNGIPYQNTYPPYLHLTVAAVATLFRCSAALAYHCVTASFYCLGGVAVFALALRLSASRAYSFFAGLFYSLISPSAFLIADIRHDLGSLWRPERLHTLLSYGEGPHVTGLLLLTLSLLMLDVAVEKRRPAWTLLAALTFAATALTNWLAAVGLAAAALAYALASEAKLRAGVTALVAAVLAYCLAAPWLPPSTVKVIEFNAKMVEGDYSSLYKTLPLNAVLILGVLALIVYTLERLRAPVIVRFAYYFTWLIGAVVLTFAWRGYAILPQPHRYHTEMEIGFALLIPFALRPILDRLPKRLQIALALVLVIATIYPAKQYRSYARILMRPVAIAQTLEFQAARWMDAHLNGGRVMATGTVSFWMNAFTDTPQFGGGFDQGTTNPNIRAAIYQLYSGDGAGTHESEIADLWLKAFGIQAVQLGGAASREHYKPWRNPHKFDGMYRELWRTGDDVILEIPQRTRSLAHVMAAADLPARTPIHGADIDPLRPYVAALGNTAYPEASFRWTSRHSAEIMAQLTPGQVVSIQISHHKGWHSSNATVMADGLGQITLQPSCAGACAFLLEYDGGLEMSIARCLPWLAIGIVGFWEIGRRRNISARR